MYIPKHYKLTDPNLIEDFVRFNGFATLVSQGVEYPEITHIPMELELDNSGNKILKGHLAKANLHGQQLVNNPKATVFFLSDFNQYISSSWYDYQDAPTWNYISVHFSGPIRIMEYEETVDSVRSLTKRYEKYNKTPVDFDSLPKSVKNQIKAVTGIEMKIEKTEAIFKLSQNQDKLNFDRIIKNLKASNNPKAIKMAETMLKLKDLFYTTTKQ